MSALGVATVGLGVGEQHARAYVRTGRCALRWLYDLDRTKAERLAHDLGGKVADSLDQVLSDSEVGAVSIASYDDAHAGQVLASLAAGKHVFVEKPLCRSVAEAQAIKAQWARDPGRHLVSNLVLRGAPLYRWLREAIAGGELGTVYAFDGDYLYGRLAKVTDGWRKDVPDYSVVQGGGIHLIDLMLWLTGERPAGVTAVGNRICTEGSGFRYDDFAAMTFRCTSGLVGRVTANFGCTHRHQHVVRVFGTAATFIYDDRGARLHRSREPHTDPVTLDLSPLPATKGDLIPAFVDAVLTGADSRDAVQHEFDVMSVCLAADRALAVRHEEEIAYL